MVSSSNKTWSLRKRIISLFQFKSCSIFIRINCSFTPSYFPITIFIDLDDNSPNFVEVFKGFRSGELTLIDWFWFTCSYCYYLIVKSSRYAKLLISNPMVVSIYPEFFVLSNKSCRIFIRKKMNYRIYSTFWITIHSKTTFKICECFIRSYYCIFSD